MYFNLLSFVYFDLKSVRKEGKRIITFFYSKEKVELAKYKCSFVTIYILEFTKKRYENFNERKVVEM